MKKITKVAILITFYNGEKYLNEQLSTILNQEKINLKIFASIDVSTDLTRELVSKLYSKNVEIISTRLKFGSAAKNFYYLISKVNLSNFDYVALSDQDDIWKKNKLFRGISLLKKNNFSGYSSDVIAFWPSGKEKYIKKSYNQTKYDFLFESAGPGSTFILKKSYFLKFQNFLKKNYSQIYDSTIPHDLLIYAYFRSFDFKWFIDNYPSLYYRQHPHNELGVNDGLFAFIKRTKIILKGEFFSNAEVIFNFFLKNSKLNFYNKNGSINYLFFARNSHLFRRNKIDQFLFKVACYFLWVKF